MKNYKAYGKNMVSEGQEIILFIGQARNKEHMRHIILDHKQMQNVSRVAYGKREYTMSDIYAGR